ncbi:kynurenine formamidase [Drosophila tropicalis]|uniref:kynurenine formamidase n=1 Tax=Drosophila tropicalis TaxID=46794 RepID=UPI0035AC17AC
MSLYNPRDSNANLNQEYLPSYHTARFQDCNHPNQAVQENFIQLTLQHEKELSSNPDIVIQNLRYGGTDDRQVVDIFHLKTTPTTGSPLFVYIHGGYWQMLEKIHSCSIVGPLLRRNHRVAVMDYNICPHVTLEELISEFESFLAWIFDYAEKTQTSEIHFAGHSAGAHLLAILLNVPHITTPERRLKVKQLFFICGVYDLRELWPLSEVNPNNILGLNATKSTALSPMLWNYPEFSLWHAGGTHLHVLTAQHESVTFIEQSRSFSECLTKAGFPVTFKMFDNYDHFDIIEETAKDDSNISRYLQNALL